MSCDFCERRIGYLRAKHAHFCPMCGDALHAGVFPTHDRLGKLNGEHSPAAEAARPKPGQPKRAKARPPEARGADGGRTCPECGGPVTRSDPRAVYCTHECQRRHNSRAQRERKRAAKAAAK